MILRRGTSADPTHTQIALARLSRAPRRSSGGRDPSSSAGFPDTTSDRRLADHRERRVRSVLLRRVATPEQLQGPGRPASRLPDSQLLPGDFTPSAVVRRGCNLRSGSSSCSHTVGQRERPRVRTATRAPSRSPRRSARRRYLRLRAQVPTLRSTYTTSAAARSSLTTRTTTASRFSRPLRAPQNSHADTEPGRSTSRISRAPDYDATSGTQGAESARFVERGHCPQCAERRFFFRSSAERRWTMPRLPVPSLPIRRGRSVHRGGGFSVDRVSVICPRSNSRDHDPGRVPAGRPARRFACSRSCASTSPER